MDKLSESADRIWNFLNRQPYGKAKVKEIRQVTGLKKQTVYNALEELKEQGLTTHEQPYWKLKETRPALKLNFWQYLLEWQDRRAERQRLQQQEENRLDAEYNRQLAARIKARHKEIHGWFKNKNSIR